MRVRNSASRAMAHRERGGELRAWGLPSRRGSLSGPGAHSLPWPPNANALNAAANLRRLFINIPKNDRFEGVPALG